jgi:hypothetical protein
LLTIHTLTKHLPLNQDFCALRATTRDVLKTPTRDSLNCVTTVIHLSLKFDDAALDTLIGILRNMQDGDVFNTEQVFLATDEAFNLSDTFRVVDEILLMENSDPFSCSCISLR